MNCYACNRPSGQHRFCVSCQKFIPPIVWQQWCQKLITKEQVKRCIELRRQPITNFTKDVGRHAKGNRP